MLALALSLYALAAVDEPYCGRRPPAIPQIAAGDRRDIELAAVGVITRHGARTPAEISQCWTGYNVSSIDWACTQPVQELALGGLRFALSYSGTPSPFGPRSSCTTGQLLDEGREQHRALGRALRAAYVGAAAAVGSALPDDLTSLPASALSLRSSNFDRTIASGEELVAALLNASAAPPPPLAWRVAAADDEWIYPNPKRCPALLALEASASAAFARDPARALPDARTREALAAAVGDGALARLRGNAALDCLMTTQCQAGVSALPAGLSAALADEAWRGLQAFEAHLLSHADGAWARLAMGPLGAELLGFVRSAVGRGARASGGSSSSAPHAAAAALAAHDSAARFALWSAHDTTVMPFLSALGVTRNRDGARDGGRDAEWAPYAAHVVLEVWRGTGAERAHRFRLVYNGAEVTRTIAGCAEVTGPCALGHLERALGAFARPVDEWRVECAAQDAAARLRAAAPPRPAAARRGAWLALLGAGLGALLALVAAGLRRGSPSRRAGRAGFAQWSASLLHPAARAAAAAHEADHLDSSSVSARADDGERAAACERSEIDMGDVTTTQRTSGA